MEVSSLIEHEVSLDIMVTLGSINPNGCLDKLQLDALFIFLAKEYVVSTTKGDFETLFCRFQQQIGDEYYFKNCFGCLYSDYSPYGQTFFGGMLCFENQKEAYLKVVDKNDILNLDTEKKYVQEIYCCNLFCKRIKGIGYRG